MTPSLGLYSSPSGLDKGYYKGHDKGSGCKNSIKVAIRVTVSLLEALPLRVIFWFRYRLLQPPKRDLSLRFQ